MKLSSILDESVWTKVFLDESVFGRVFLGKLDESVLTNGLTLSCQGATPGVDSLSWPQKLATRPGPR